MHRNRFLPLLLIVAVTGCQTPLGQNLQQRWNGTEHPKTPRARAISKAQQDAYDRGVRLYAEEDYPGARDAWREAYRLDASTTVGQQAQEHLAQVEKMIANLQKMEAR